MYTCFRLMVMFSQPLCIYLYVPLIALVSLSVCMQSHRYPESLHFRQYDTLDYPPQLLRQRVRRSAAATSVIFPINAFGKSIRLVLFPDMEVVQPNGKLIVGGREWVGGLRTVTEHAVRGYVDGFTQSVVFGSVIDGVFRGTVSLDKNKLIHSPSGSYDTYYIEPTGYYFTGDLPFHSIIYSAVDVKTPNSSIHGRVRRASHVTSPNFCGWSDPTIVERMTETSQPDGFTHRRGITLRSRRSFFEAPVSTSRTSYIPNHQNSLAHLYHMSHSKDNVSAPYKGGGPNTRVCNLYLQSDTYLWDHVINMRHIRGNRELAVKEITSIFTQHVQGAQLIYQDAVFRDHAVALKVSQLTFAHEMGHNFGAKHDDDHKNEPYACLPSVDDIRGNYIMFASATSGDKENNNKFSNCSLDSIARLLDRILWDETNCFLSSDGQFCGNQLIEDGEECDCGFTKVSCRDKCCHPKDSVNPCKLVNTILIDNIQHAVQCSPTAGVCCTENCQYRSETHMCRPAGECHRASNCSGKLAKCPPVDILPDGTLCQDHTRVCKQGQCIGSICERIPGWHECSLTRDKKVTPELMCFVACKQNISGAPCISTFQLETNPTLRAKYPQLVVELLRNGYGTKLPPGAPCDNYRGYCDVFRRCVSVDAEGPLARLRNLIFSPQMLQKMKTWITMHWWAVILITLAVIIGMIIFVKLFAVSTPAARLHSIERNRPTLSPFLPPTVIPSGSVNEPVLWTVTGHSLRWLSPPNPSVPSYRSHSPWGWSRRPKNIQTITQYPITSNKVCILPNTTLNH
ncbi:unnamed protein product [Heterobilharzia americana]|nr:unnamed protein product [Heterobilharzia americana]